MASSDSIKAEIEKLKKKKKKYEKCIDSIEECNDFLTSNMETALSDLNTVYVSLADFSSDNSKGSMIIYFATTAETKKIDFQNMKTIMTESKGDIVNRLEKAQEIVEELKGKIEEKEREYQEALSREREEWISRMLSNLRKG